MSRKLKTILVLLVVFVLGGAVWPMYNFGMEKFTEYQYGKTVLEDIRYQVIESIESTSPDLFVLSIDASTGIPVAHILLQPKLLPVFEDDADLTKYVVGRINDVSRALSTTYPDRPVYRVLIYLPLNVQATTGAGPLLGLYLYETWEFVDGVGNLTNFWMEIFTYTQLTEATFQIAMVYGVAPVVYGQAVQIYYNLIAGGWIIPVDQLDSVVIDRGPDYSYPWE